MSTTIEHETQFDRAAHARAFLEQLANTLGMSTNAPMVFSQPVERDGVTVIPVARIRLGGGVGGGTASNGGAGVSASPIGYIELRDGKARFHRIYDTTSLMLMGIVVALLLRSVLKVLRA